MYTMVHFKMTTFRKFFGIDITTVCFFFAEKSADVPHEFLKFFLEHILEIRTFSDELNMSLLIISQKGFETKKASAIFIKNFY